MATELLHNFECDLQNLISQVHLNTVFQVEFVYLWLAYRILRWKRCRKLPSWACSITSMIWLVLTNLTGLQWVVLHGFVLFSVWHSTVVTVQFWQKLKENYEDKYQRFYDEMCYINVRFTYLLNISCDEPSNSIWLHQSYDMVRISRVYCQ